MCADCRQHPDHQCGRRLCSPKLADVRSSRIVRSDNFMLWPVTAVSRCISAIMVRVAVLRLSARRLSTASSADQHDDLVGESSPRYKNDAFNYDFSHCCSIRPNRPSTNTSVTACLRRIHPKSTAKPEISTRVLICRSCCLPLHLTPNQRLSVQQILQ